MSVQAFQISKKYVSSVIIWLRSVTPIHTTGPKTNVPLQSMRYVRLAKKRLLEFKQRTSSSSSCLEEKAHMLNSGLLSGRISPFSYIATRTPTGSLREFFPKGTDFAQVAHDALADALAKINGRPRKCLNWETAHEAFTEEVLRLI